VHSLPVFLRLTDRPVILLGESDAAHAKRRLLKRAGAIILGESGTAALAIVAIEDGEDAKAIRQRLEALLPTRLGKLAEALHAARPTIRARFPDASDRRHAIDAALEPGAMLDPLADTADDAVARWLDRVAAKTLPRLIEIRLRSPDPDQLTLAEARWLAQADTVVHDPGVPPAIVDRARADAMRLPPPLPDPPRAGLTIFIRDAVIP